MANHLIHEKSPYLLQHANNPVAWHPWSTEAFDKARKENKPVFLSVGYATCHWCHVMEKESFEDPQAAALLNDVFVCIKVDREERPDIDAVYMAACQMITGSGGWPLTVVMTPDKKPFFAGTYLPKTSRFGRLGLVELCTQIKALWHSDPKKVQDAAQGITKHLGKAFFYPPGSRPRLGMEVLDQAYAQTARIYDPQYGGFGGAPKFPTPHRLMFLLRNHHRTAKADALKMTIHTMTAMRMGGLWDHVGFGFHRYATDKQWLLPHFEKMLYDQALMAIAYLEAYQVTGDLFLAQTAKEIFTYILRDMTAPQGAFWTAEDADSDGEEGKFYVWRLQDFEEVVNQTASDIPWQRIFNLIPEGNFEDEATRKKLGANILHLRRSFDQWERALNLAPRTLNRQWDKLRENLFAVRRRRVAPLKDDKILTDWNGLMIAALALGARVLGDRTYAKAALKAVEFIREHLLDPKGRLRHRYRDGQAAIDGQAGDYAYFIMGLIELYRSSFETDLLEQAIRLQEIMDIGFWDHEQGGYFLTASDNHELPVRPKELSDGALPSANSVALSNLLLLAKLTGDSRWEQRAHDLTRTFAAQVARQPVAFTHFLNGLDMALQPGREVVVTGRSQAADTRAILEALQTHFAPHLVTHLKSEQNAAHLSRLVGFTNGLTFGGEQATAHVCTNFNCQSSTSDVTILLQQLSSKAPDRDL